MKFYDLHLYSGISIGESSVKELADFAEKLGWSGIAICDAWQDIERIKELKKAIESSGAKIDVAAGVTIKPQTTAELKNILDKVRESVEIVVVSGGIYDINRAACEDSRVDALANPETFEGSGLDEVCLAAAAKNNVAIEINFRYALRSFRRSRARALENIATNIMLASELKAPLVLCSGAQSKWDLRAPRELVALANALGFELTKSFSAASSLPEQIISNNRKKLEGKVISQGVEMDGA